MPFFPDEDIWSAVRDGVIRSVDLDNEMQFNPAVRPESSTPFQQQSPPRVLHRSVSQPHIQPRRLARVPVVPLGDVNVSVLSAEILRMEFEVASLKRQLHTQDRLIKGFCGLYIGGKENS